MDASGFEPESPVWHIGFYPVRHQSHALSFGKWSYPRFCFTPSSVSKHCCSGDMYAAHTSMRCITPLRQDSGFTSKPRIHLPCSRLDIHLATAIADNAGGHLPHRFAPVPFWRMPLRVGILSVAVVVIRPLRNGYPDLLFHQATCAVRLPTPRVGKFLSRHCCRERRNTCLPIFFSC